jgi:YD repeat-containing protein
VHGLLLNGIEAIAFERDDLHREIERTQANHIAQTLQYDPAGRLKQQLINHVDAKQGINLKSKKRSERSALLSAAAKNKTFEECANAYMEAHSSDYTNDKHRKQWGSTLTTYAYPIIGNILASDIGMSDVLAVLLQETQISETEKGKLWYLKTETAKRLLGRITSIQ